MFAAAERDFARNGIKGPQWRRDRLSIDHDVALAYIDCMLPVPDAWERMSSVGGLRHRTPFLLILGSVPSKSFGRFRECTAARATKPGQPSMGTRAALVCPLNR